MRLLKNILWASAAAFAAAACTIVSEDTFSTAPAAPVMDAHSDILITEGTKVEDVTFSWSKARFIDTDEILYDVYVSDSETDVLLKKDVKETFYTLPKEDFRTFLLDNFKFEKNTTHDISVHVTVADRNGEAYPSSKLALKVYYYEAAVPAVVTGKETNIVLDKETPSENVELLSWEEARLVYGEDVTYKVVLSVGEGAESVLAEGLYATSWSMTVDALNEAVIAAGGAEDAESEAQFKVYAICESIPDGVPSETVSVKVTTYIATFPDYMYLAGSHQGWAPATTTTILPQSAKTKGLYQGFIDLTTADGADVEFKFCITNDWGGDFGFSDVAVVAKGSEELPFSVAEASTVAGDNIKVPSGFYYIRLDKKFGKLTMVETHNLELIGGWDASWAAPVEMTWDAEAKTWTASRDMELVEGTEFKVRFNSDWDYSFGGEMGTVEFGGGNMNFGKADGTYKMILSAKSSDFYINAVDINMPDYLVLPGNYSGHSWNPADDFRVYLIDSQVGIYRAAVTMYDCTQGFKIAKSGQWLGLTGSVEEGFAIEGDANGMIENGTYCWEINLSTNTATATPVTKVGMIGGFNSWGGDAEMTFDPETLTYTGELVLEEKGEWKFRFNGGWDFNYGLKDGILVNNGDNIVSEAGTYTVVLDIAHGSYATYTMTKK